MEYYFNVTINCRLHFIEGGGVVVLQVAAVLDGLPKLKVLFYLGINH